MFPYIMPAYYWMDQTEAQQIVAEFQNTSGFNLTQLFCVLSTQRQERSVM